jgi:hypothetical protein
MEQVWVGEAIMTIIHLTHKSKRRICLSSALCLSEEFRWNSGGIPVIPEVNNGKVGKIPGVHERETDGTRTDRIHLHQNKLSVVAHQPRAEATTR